VTKAAALTNDDHGLTPPGGQVEHFDGAVLATPEGASYRAAAVTAVYDAHGRLDRVAWSEGGVPYVVPARWVVKLTRART
jgi:hypothetical protein